MQTQTFGKWIALLAACFLPISCLAYSSTQKMEAISSFEKSVGFQWTIDHYI
jgi:hypothetical protein